MPRVTIKKIAAKPQDERSDSWGWSVIRNLRNRKTILDNGQRIASTTINWPALAYADWEA